MWKSDKALELIKREGRTREWLAEQCGIEHRTLNNILRGAQRPGKPVLLLMARALNTTVEELDPEQAKAG